MSMASDIILASAGYDHEIRFWKANTGACLKFLNHNESQVNCMAISPDKTKLATGGYQHVSIYDTMSNNQQPIYNLEGTAKNTVSIGFHEKGAWMYTAGEDKTIRIWDMKSSKISRQYTHPLPISCAV